MAEGLLSIGALILGIIIWLAFNSLVTRWYFGSSCLSVIISIVGEIIVCIIIAGVILSLIGELLAGLFGFVGGVLLFLIKAALVIIAIGAVIGIIYFIYNKIKGNNVDFGNVTDKVKSFTKQNSSETEYNSDVSVSPDEANEEGNAQTPAVDDTNQETVPQSLNADEMYCGGCGKIVSRSIKFCPYCGKQNQYTQNS